MSVIGKNIKKYRVAQGLTQKELGQKCGMADSAIRRYENGGANPKEETLEKIAYALGTTTSELRGKIDLQLFAAPSETAPSHSIGINQMSLNLVNSFHRYEVTIETKKSINENLDKLNPTGQKEAVKRVEELTHIEKYTKKD